MGGAADNAALARLSSLEAKLRVFTKHVAIAKTLAATLAPFRCADLRANAQSAGRERREREGQKGASHMCDTMSLVRELGRVCPDPPTMTRKVAVGPDRARLREYWQM